MAIGKFDETNENNETNEVKENTDNTEKPRNQILETPEHYDDDFDKKLDQNESKNESSGDKPQEFEKGKGEESEKNGILDRLRNLFSKKESNEVNSSDNSEDGNFDESPSKGESFRDSLKVENSDNHIESHAIENTEKKNVSSVETDSDTNENNNDVSKDRGRSRAEEAYNRQFHIRDDDER